MQAKRGPVVVDAFRLGDALVVEACETWARCGWESTTISKTGDYLVVVLSNAPECFDLTRVLVRALDNAHKLF